MNSKILVTGATGTIGSFVVDLLKENKASFVAMVPFSFRTFLEQLGIKAKKFGSDCLRIGSFVDDPKHCYSQRWPP